VTPSAVPSVWSARPPTRCRPWERRLTRPLVPGRERECAPPVGACKPAPRSVRSRFSIRDPSATRPVRSPAPFLLVYAAVFSVSLQLRAPPVCWTQTWKPNRPVLAEILVAVAELGSASVGAYPRCAGSDAAHGEGVRCGRALVGLMPAALATDKEGGSNYGS
jgi:hypothetical protein